MIQQTSALIVLVLATSAGPLLAAPDLSKLPPAAAKEGVTYDKDIRPLFEASCNRCHGPEKPKGGLRLDSAAAVLKGGKEGKVVVPGQSAKSQLVISVARIDAESAMPPKPREVRGKKRTEGGTVQAAGTNQPAGRAPKGPPAKPLTPEEVGLVRAWVDQGAK
jgi:hypothetical protein